MNSDKSMHKIVILNSEQELTGIYHHLKRDFYNCWRIRFTIRKENGKGKRMNYSLKTTDLATAQTRRDKILADLDSKGLLKKRRQECYGNKYNHGKRPRNPHPFWENWEWRNPEDKLRYEAWLKLNPIESTESTIQGEASFGDDTSKDQLGRATEAARAQDGQNIQGGAVDSLLPSSNNNPINLDNKNDNKNE